MKVGTRIKVKAHAFGGQQWTGRIVGLNSPENLPKRWKVKMDGDNPHVHLYLYNKEMIVLEEKKVKLKTVSLWK